MRLYARVRTYQRLIYGCFRTRSVTVWLSSKFPELVLAATATLSVLRGPNLVLRLAK